MNPRAPVYIISKGRSESRLTSKALEKLGVSYSIVVEPDEVDAYSAVIDPSKVIRLDMSYKDRYETCHLPGHPNTTGSGPARNFVWDHAVRTGARWHWIMDDNISGFYRLNWNLKTPVASGTIFRVMESFVERYENISMAGPNYFMFASRKSKMPPYVANTRIYSCNLIRNDAPYRWRGRYNEDTDLSLRMLKDGWCTVLFNAFLQYKTTSMQMTGGNTDELYVDDGRLYMAESIAAQHPDVARVSVKWGRYQHHVDYSDFQRLNRLERRPSVVVREGVDNFGMILQQQGDDGAWREIARP